MTEARPAHVATRRTAPWTPWMLAAILPILAACGSAEISAYHGEPPSASQLVIVEIAPGLEVVSVDQNPAWHGRSTADNPLSLSFPEGNHILEIRLRRDEQEGQMAIHEITTTLSDPVAIDGYFRGMRRYRIGYTELASSWKPTIEDVTPEN